MKYLIIAITAFILSGCNEPPKPNLAKDIITYRCWDNRMFIIYRYGYSSTITQILADNGKPLHCKGGKSWLQDLTKPSSHKKPGKLDI